MVFESEDTINAGLIIFRIFVGGQENSWQRRLYIKLEDNNIVEYKGVQEDTVVDGISIKFLARSEDDRVTYMPNAEMTNNITTIPITSKDYKVSGVIVEKCTCKRQMIYTTNDLAYMQDIEVLNKKIDALAEQSHMNDVQTLSLQNDDYATIDEVNTVLTQNYVQKTELDSYAKKNDVYDKTYMQDHYYDRDEVDSAYTNILSIVDSDYYTRQATDNLFMKKTDADKTYATKAELPQTGNLEDYRKKDDLEFIIPNNITFRKIDENRYELDDFKEGAIFEVRFYNSQSKERYAKFEFTRIEMFSTDTRYFTSLKSDGYDYEPVNYAIWDYNSDTGKSILRLSNNRDPDKYPLEIIELISITYGDIVTDSLALKSEVEELRTKITSLEARLAALENK